MTSLQILAATMSVAVVAAFEAAASPLGVLAAGVLLIVAGAAVYQQGASANRRKLRMRSPFSAA